MAGQAAACARLALGNVERARWLASEEGEALRADVDRIVAAALAGGSGEPGARSRGAGCWTARTRGAWRPRSAWPPSATRGWRASPRGATAARSSASSTRPPAATAAGRGPRCWTWGSRSPRSASGTWCAWRRGAELAALDPERAGALAPNARSRDPRRLRAAAERCEETRLALELNVTEDLALEALGYRLAGLVGST